MDIKEMSKFYERGMYSPINFYLGVIALLKNGSDVHYIMREVPESLLGEIKELAERHRDAATKNHDLRELDLTSRILAWKQPPSSSRARGGTAKAVAATNGATSMAVRAIKSTRGARQRLEQAERAAILLKQISGPTRVQVILMLSEGERHVGDLCDDLQQSQPAVSHHLALLRRSGLVIPRRQGKNNFYSLTDSGEELARVVKGLIAGSSERAQSRTGLRASLTQE